jgi:hypothetical protein
MEWREILSYGSIFAILGREVEVAGGVPSTVQGSSDLFFERTFATSGYLNSHMVRVRSYLELDH